MARLPHTVFCVTLGTLLPHFTGRKSGGRDQPCWKASAGAVPRWYRCFAGLDGECCILSQVLPLSPLVHPPPAQPASLLPLGSFAALNTSLRASQAGLGHPSSQQSKGRLSTCPRSCSFPLALSAEQRGERRVAARAQPRCSTLRCEAAASP